MPKHRHGDPMSRATRARNERAARIAREGPSRGITASLSFSLPVDVIATVGRRAEQWRVSRSRAASRLIEAGDAAFAAAAAGGGEADDPE